MNNKNLVVIAFVVVLLVVIAAFMTRTSRDTDDAVFEQTVSTPEITFGYPDDFGLVVTPEQILVHSYIPPCMNFDYCLYYNDDTYTGTNFGSAGIGIKKRTDLATSAMCLEVPPEGYSDFSFKRVETPEYSMSYGSVGGGAAGHFDQGVLYRVSFADSCYQFETSVSQSQFLNYEPGSIKEFTAADEAIVLGKIEQILDNVTITETEQKISFPKAE